MYGPNYNYNVPGATPANNPFVAPVGATAQNNPFVGRQVQYQPAPAPFYGGGGVATNYPPMEFPGAAVATQYPGLTPPAPMAYGQPYPAAPMGYVPSFGYQQVVAPAPMAYGQPIMQGLTPPPVAAPFYYPQAQVPMGAYAARGVEHVPQPTSNVPVASANKADEQEGLQQMIAHYNNRMRAVQRELGEIQLKLEKANKESNDPNKAVIIASLESRKEELIKENDHLESQHRQISQILHEV